MKFSQRALKKKLNTKGPVTVDGITFHDGGISFKGINDTRKAFDLDMSGKRVQQKRASNQRLARKYKYSMIE